MKFKKKGQNRRGNSFAHSTLFALILSAICMIAMAEISYTVSSNKIKQLAEQNYAFFTGEKTQAVTEWFLREAAFLDSQVYTLTETDLIEDHDRLTEYVTAYVESGKDEALFDFYFVDTNNVMASGIHYDNVTEDPDFDYRLRDWYTDAQHHRGVRLSTAYMDQITGQMCVTLSEKVVKDGEFRGVLCFDVFVTSMFEMFTTEDMPDNSYSFIVDNKGGVIYHPAAVFKYEENPIPIYSAGVEGYDRIYTVLLTGKQGVSIVDYDGVERTFYFDKQEDYGWYVISAIDTTTVLKDHEELRHKFTIIAIIVFVIAMCLEVWLRFAGMNQAKEEYKEVEDLAHKDRLTHLYNRLSYEEDVKEYDDGNIPPNFCFLMFDMNGLKRTNDTKGHEAGDQIIKAVADSLVATYAAYGKIYRTGGDEFVVIVDATKEELTKLYAQFNECIEAWTKEHFDGLSTSYGEAVHLDYPELSVQELAKIADNNMYRDKDRYYKESGIDRRRR